MGTQGLIPTILPMHNLGFGLLNSGRPETIPVFIFGIGGVLAAAGDIRMIRAGGIPGPRRIARHLWRMCFAMWVAAASFFWRPPDRVPEVIRVPALQVIAVLMPLLVMLYWLWRLRVRSHSAEPARPLASRVEPSFES